MKYNYLFALLIIVGCSYRYPGPNGVAPIDTIYEDSEDGFAYTAMQDNKGWHRIMPLSKKPNQYGIYSGKGLLILGGDTLERPDNPHDRPERTDTLIYRSNGYEATFLGNEDGWYDMIIGNQHFDSPEEMHTFCKKAYAILDKLNPEKIKRINP